MYTHVTLPPSIPDILVNKIMELGRDIGDFCPYWIEKDILEALPANLKEKYLKQCHQPLISFRDDDRLIEIRCCGCSITSNLTSCNRTFPHIAARLQLDFDRNLQQKHEVEFMHKDIRKIEKAEKKVSKGLKKLEKKDIKMDKKMDKLKKKKKMKK